MDKEQSIEELLRQLRHTVEQTPEQAVEENTDAVPDMSTEALKQELMQRFGSTDTVATEEAEEYRIDHEFYMDAKNETAEEATEDEPVLTAREETAEEEAFEEVTEDEPPFDMEDEALDGEVAEDEPVLTSREETVEEEAFEEFAEGVTEDEPPFDMEDEVLDGEVTEDESVLTAREETVEEETFEENTEDEAPTETAEVYEEPAYVSLPLDAIATEEDEVEPAYDEEDDPERILDQGMRALPLSLLEDTPKAFETDGSMQLAMFEGVASPAEEMRTEPTDPDGTPADADEWQEVIDFDMAEPEPDAELTLGEMELDDATMDLMLEMGYQGTVRRTVSPERMNEFLLHERQRRQTPPPADAYAYEGEEYEKEEQAESIFRRYTHEKYMLLLRLLGSAAFFVLLLLYELLPLLGISFSNLPTFDDAPVATMYIGIQLLVLCGVFAWRELWGGLKKGLTLRAELWSVPALACVMNVIYSVAVLAVAQETTVHTFHTLTAFFILMGLVSEYLRLCREIRSFAVYTAKGRKFTLSDSREKNGVAEQMHRGGLSYDTVVMEPRAVRFPHGYFSSVNEQSEADPFLNLILTPLVVLTATFGVAAMVLGASAQEAIESAMIAFFALAPVSVFAVHTLPIEVLSRRLFRRNCTVAGEAMVEKYAACDVLVLHDMHMYREVAASDCGIVIYDKEHALRILACLDALYHVIGGPMRETFSQVGDRVPTPDIQIRRLARNGVEAVTERESLLLGDESFLARYGIAMTEGKGSLGRLGVCRNGKLVAMLRVRYRTEEVFDMLYRNMSASGIGCALQTFDPAISGAFVARTRRSEGLPISVVHRSARALSQEAERPVTEPVGLLAIGSRLKLAECLIYCRKLYRVMKLSHRAQYVAFVLITLGLVALLPFGALGVMHQWWLMLLHAVLSAGMLIPVLCGMPKKQDFMLDATENNEQSKGNTSTQ